MRHGGLQPMKFPASSSCQHTYDGPPRLFGYCLVAPPYAPENPWNLGHYHFSYLFFRGGSNMFQQHVTPGVAGWVHPSLQPPRDLRVLERMRRRRQHGEAGGAGFAGTPSAQAGAAREEPTLGCRWIETSILVLSYCIWLHKNQLCRHTHIYMYNIIYYNIYIYNYIYIYCYYMLLYIYVCVICRWYM